MLSAIVAPPGAAGGPAWVVSSFGGDLALVPADRLDEASGVLQAAGHQSGGTEVHGVRMQPMPLRIGTM